MGRSVTSGTSGHVAPGRGLAFHPGAGEHYEEAIRKVWAEFSEAWRRNDAAGRASLWLEDGTLINPFGLEARGRAQIQRIFEHEVAGFAKDSTNTGSGFVFHPIAPDVVSVDANIELVGAKDPAGNIMPPIKLHLFATMVKRSGRWWIADARPYAISPAPGGASQAAVRH